MTRRGTAARIDLGELEKLAALQCTNEEIAFWFGGDHADRERRRQQRPFREAIERVRAKGRILMRRAQLRMLENGNFSFTFSASGGVSIIVSSLRLRRSYIGWTQALHFLPRQRLSGICCQSLLLPCESHRRLAVSPSRLRRAVLGPPNSCRRVVSITGSSKRGKGVSQLLPGW